MYTYKCVYVHRYIDTNMQTRTYMYLWMYTRTFIHIQTDSSSIVRLFRLSYPPIRWQKTRTEKAKVPIIPKILQGNFSSSGIEAVCLKDEYTV